MLIIRIISGIILLIFSYAVYKKLRKKESKLGNNTFHAKKGDEVNIEYTKWD